jgi:two-component system LytT family sensor kinase
MGESPQHGQPGVQAGNAAIDRVRELERMVADLRVLQDFSSTLLHHHLGIDDILWDVVRLAVARLDLEDCVIYLLDRDRGDLVQRAAFGPKNPKEREILNPIRLQLGRGIVGSVALSGKVELISDTRQDPRYVQDDEMRL